MGDRLHQTRTNTEPACQHSAVSLVKEHYSSHLQYTAQARRRRGTRARQEPGDAGNDAAVGDVRETVWWEEEEEEEETVVRDCCKRMARGHNRGERGKHNSIT